MNLQEEDQDTVQTSAHNPFPEPQTIPSGWDTSAFISRPLAVADAEVDEDAEKEAE